MKTIKITVDPYIYLNQIPEFKNGIPNNSFIHKGRCGIGGTTIELKHHRHSIIIVPTVAPIKGKLNIGKGKECKVQNGLFPLYGGKNFKKGKKLQHVIDYLESDEVSDSGFKKIFTTPDSFEAIIHAAVKLNKLDWLYDNFFLLLDESHSIICESFRKKIRNPLKYFWKFKGKAIISATPFYFSDPIFEKLQKYEITFTEKLGEIKLVNTTNTRDAINYILTNPIQYPGNVHIFYNTVKQLAELLRTVLIENPDFDCNIFCSLSDDNLEKLDELKSFVNEDPNTAVYKKYNFYTTKYFEAWDLHDLNKPTIILVTDFNGANTKVGIQNKGVQAIGRFRIVNKVQPHKIIHITNTRGTYDWKDFPEIYKQINLDADSAIKAYNENIRLALKTGLQPSKELQLIAEKYAEFDPNTINIEVKKDSILVDQWANLVYSNQIYNNIQFVKKAWEQAHYVVKIKVIPDDLLESIWPRLIAEKIRVFCVKVESIEKDKDEYLIDNSYDLALTRLNNNFEHFELGFKAYHKLGMAKLVELKFNKTLIIDELFSIAEKIAKAKIETDIKNVFELNKNYEKAEVKDKLQKLYIKHTYVDRKGKMLKAKANNIESFCAAIIRDRNIEITDYKI